MTRVPSDSSDSYASQRPSGEKGASPSIEASSSSTWRSLNVRTRRGHHRTQERDLPRKTPSSTEALLRRAHFAGASIGTLCEHIYRTEGQPGVRRVLRLLSLAKKHGARRPELLTPGSGHEPRDLHRPSRDQRQRRLVPKRNSRSSYVAGLRAGLAIGLV